MARGKRKKKAELGAQADPRAALDGAAFLAASQGLLKTLDEDLLARVEGSAAVKSALRARHEAEKAARRTGDAFEQWLRSFVTQVSAAWLLSCVFVRVLEDRGLLGRARIAGPGATDAQRLFVELAPHLTEREYLLTVFRELSRLPAAKELFDAKHNPVWLLAPSAEGAKALLALFRAPTAEEPAFRFGQSDTRFLGDLYQDLSEDVRKRYALLQTPSFVEEYILDRTLTRAIERFGLARTTLIDPTCGSGHFLLGAFARLVDAWMKEEPGLEARVAAQRALDQVAGADINPYAIAITRFRLLLAFVEVGGYGRLVEVPGAKTHLAVADSLLHGFAGMGQGTFADVGTAGASEMLGGHYALADEEAARDVLGKTYAAVVGNPPYITVKDAVVREEIRKRYPKSAAGKYALAAPFVERFFRLAVETGYVGMINSNAFMKREFGKKLIEEFLPTVNLDGIVNTSGAYIPGHGTPTVLLFGSHEAPVGTDVLAVLAKRGEPSTPEDAAKGLVWSSVVGHASEVGFEDEFISVARVARNTLDEHPWSLGGGGAAELMELLQSGASTCLGDLAEDIGFASFIGLDDAFMIPASVARTQQLEPAVIRPIVTGEDVRDWAVQQSQVAIVPYKTSDHTPIEYQPDSRWGRFLWPYRTVAERVVSFGSRTRKENGDNWWEWYRWQTERYLAPYRVTFAFVATHNHFVLDRGGKVFKQSAPIIKLKAGATEDDHLALLGYLNSSIACFWMKQVSQNKGSGTDSGKWQDDPAKIAFEFTATQLAELPLPKGIGAMASLAKELSEVAARRETIAASPFDPLPRASRAAEGAIARAVDDYSSATRRLIALQEQVDWTVYRELGLCDADLVGSCEEIPASVALGERPFEMLAARTFVEFGLDGQPLAKTPPQTWPAPARDLWERRIAAVESSPSLGVLESPEFKRRWVLTPKSTGGRCITFEDLFLEAGKRRIAAAVEHVVAKLSATPLPLRKIVEVIGAYDDVQLSAFTLNRGVPVSSEQIVATYVDPESVPYLAAWRHSEAGLRKREAWESTWGAQRVEDRSAASVPVEVPPKYDRKDFATERFWELRGKLDVPKERFISYPGCEADEDGERIFGWAGWDHLQRTQALATLYQQRKNEGWEAARLAPMLAGVLELLPWVKHWHNEPSTEFGGQRLGDFFELFLDGECSELRLTRPDLHAWRPPLSGKRSAKRRKTSVDDQGTDQ